ncbi:hypothetical protein AD006_12350 [Pseudonocardia sp. EC080610-09]|uniref:hypothetical protein n=1 Tax=unclassified Pseudonocardia TaxID=2619320 RepID=UPI0006CB210B|nr:MULTISPECIES: hypothetical protein [unclassified Pseudonocardia]ALE72583.1 hypothetical protein FRP1_04705 [Pseudonocardia sp. EC080625-04]ALL75897.1 hypothetical protein AD006_12350 [Pseudonocardia sp. EC080610-09]ALL82924.1 hypothetical protein AD017_20180 [Pseudonocardia sp. EC080619-01]
MNDDHAPPATPDGLGEAGIELFRSIADDYELFPGQVRLLFDAASEADLISEMDRQWRADGSPLTTHGSRNQLVAHPMVSELRFHRATLASLITKLNLETEYTEDDAPEAGNVVPMSRTDVARKAANARWGRRGYKAQA